MVEARRAVLGEAILSGVTTMDRPGAERERVEHKNEMLEALVRDHSRLVYRIAYAVLRRHHDAEDATQETFLRVLRYSSKLADVEQPKTWLARIAWRVAVERSRRQIRTQEMPLQDPENPSAEIVSAEATADAVVRGSQVSAALEKLVAALPERLRRPLLLTTIEELSPKEVAATLSINEAAVRSRVFRARQILKEKLSNQLTRNQR